MLTRLSAMNGPRAGVEFYEQYSRGGWSYEVVGGSPAPKYDIDPSVPTLSDIAGGDNMISNQFASSTVGVWWLFASIYNDIVKLSDELMEGERVYVPQEKFALCVSKTPDIFFHEITKRLRYIFYRKKDNAWVSKIAMEYIEMAKAPNQYYPEPSYFFSFQNMRPFIERNYCCIKRSSQEEESEMPVGEMYANLHTFLCGTKRKSHPISKLGSDVLIKIFDYLQITGPRPNFTPWKSFGEKRIRNA